MFYANDRRTNDLTQAVISIIRNAKRYIKTGNFLFQDREVVSELCQASAERGVAVFIISNTKGEENKTESGPNSEIKVNTHIPNLEKLKTDGAHCRFLDSLHAKFILADGMDGILMSANYSPNSMAGNIELGLSLGQNEINDLEYTFNVLYMNSDIQEFGRGERNRQVTRFYSPVNQDFFNSLKMTSNIRLTIAPPPYPKRRPYESNLKNCHVTTIYRSIVDIIKNATEFVYVVTWHFNFLEGLKEFTEAVQEAINRGVKVYLYSNVIQVKEDGVDYSRMAIQELLQMGCFSKGDDRNHSKCVISECEGIIFTANIDGISGMTTGFEVGCILEGQVLDDAKKYVKSLFE